MPTECNNNFNRINFELRQIEEYINQLQTENEQLYLRNHQHTYCAYCGREFPADVEGAIDEVEAHIFACAKHPIAYIKKFLVEKVILEIPVDSPSATHLHELVNFIDKKALGGE